MISVLIPTIRPQNIPKILECLKVACPEGYEVIWEEDVDRIGAPKMLARLVARARHEWVAFIGDDTEPQPGCIEAALRHARENGLLVVGLNDLQTLRGTHWVASKSLLDSLENREFFYTGYIHNFCDDELRIRAERMGAYGWCEAAKIAHGHPAYGSAPKDPTYEKQLDRGNWAKDKALFESRNGRVSVVLIVKNEEAMLAECLVSVKDADEIVVVDTGSIDRTREIAGCYTDKVYDFAWVDDFAAARNFAASKATGDWILSIDADELLEPGGMEKIREAILTVRHAIGIRMTTPGTSYHVPRLFRNIPSVRWAGRIHETINMLEFDRLDVAITYRSSPAHALDPKRNIRILEAAHRDDPAGTRTMYYLAREYAYYQEWAKAEAMFERYLRLATWLPEKADAHFMAALCYWYDGMGNGEKTRQHCLSAMNINANFRAPILLMAAASFEANAAQWRRMAETADNSGTLFARERFDVI